ncbi:hypothetical protein [Motiliproteus sediminis]|uniref:hypothetical protein n=1 Tax=Motiliproteus sediminis TaxID=1468178 RepID=UPI001AEFB707|nr:hypothetical protein [Motiliproteus sediminis]
MHANALSLLLITTLLAGCAPSFEEEYKAAQAEIASLKQQLAETQRKLRAADNEVRHKIFTLARRANNYLQSTTFDAAEIDRLHKELLVHLDSYTQLNGAADQVALVARFYTDKLDTILTLRKDAMRAYDRQYNACLSDLDSSGKKSDISTMLCEVQADVARKDPSTKLLASTAALIEVGRELLDSERQDGTASMSLEQAENRFQGRIDELVKNPAS